ncbi:MAG: radical SAM protein [Candidatus Bathyarchaeia archaeon]
MRVYDGDDDRHNVPFGKIADWAYLMVVFVNRSLPLRLAWSFIRYKLGRPKLTYVVYCCTARCNLRCVFCGWWRRPRPELATEGALKVVAQLADFGVCTIDFSGGEPTLRRDLAALASSARDYGLFTVLSTNGTLLDEEKVRELGSVFDVVNVSLDGFAATHDATRGVPGTFERAKRALRLLSELGEAKVGVDLTVHRGNISETLKLFQALREEVDFVSFQPIQPYPPPDDLAITVAEAEALAEGLLAMKRGDPSYVGPSRGYISLLKPYFARTMEKLCDASVLYAMVDPAGGLLGCTNWPQSHIGDLTRHSLRELWDSEHRQNSIKSMAACPGCMSQCTTLVSMSYRGGLSLSDLRGMLALSRRGGKAERRWAP